MENIKVLREKIGLTQVGLAEALGVTQACVAMWENGKALPNSDKLPKLAEVLGCTIDDLYRKEH